MGTFKNILTAFVFALIMIALYQVLKVFVIKKVKNKKMLKYVSLTSTVIMLVISTFVSYKFKANSIEYYVSMAFLMISILTAVDIWLGKYQKTDKNNNSTYDSSIKPRPKAKPNRVKNMHKK